MPNGAAGIFDLLSLSVIVVTISYVANEASYLRLDSEFLRFDYFD